MPSKLKKAIGAVKDQTSISLAKVASNTSSTLEVAVLKATSHDDVPVDDRYVQEVIKLVSSNKAYAAACARAIGKRIGRTRNWIVALKSLMLVLRIFQDGDPYFPREVLHAMKRGAKILNLSSFRDDSNSSPWDFTAFVRTFALYLDERLDCFLTGKLQRRYNNRERENSSSHYRTSMSSRRRGDEPVRDMKPVMLLDKISYWQRLIERAIATRPTGAAKTNRLVQIALYAVVQESFDLYKDISDGLALVLDSFFHLPYQSCVNAFQTCVKAAKQFEEISAFYSVCKSIGVGRTSEYPSVQTISEELIETLQEFLKDQSSFPANTPTKSHLLLPGPGGSTRTTSSKRDSYGGQSEFSLATETTEPYSERSINSGVDSRCTSLEDLISATETWKSPANISIDLEAYSDIQFEKQLHEKDDTGSTHSLPVSNSMVDLVSLPDWQGYDEDDERKQEEDKQQKQEAVKDQEINKEKAAHGQEHKQNPSLDSNSAKEWELVLTEAIPSTSFNAFPEQPKTEHLPRNEAKGSSTEAIITPSASFNAFPEQGQENTPTNEAKGSSAEEVSSSNGWELVLFENIPQAQSTQSMPSTTNNVNSFNFATLDELYNQNPMPMFPNGGQNTQYTASTNNFWNDQNLSLNLPPPNNGLNAYTHQNPVLPAPQHYNPFLQDTSMDLAMVPVTTATTTATATYPTMATNAPFTFPTSTDMFSSSTPAPTFQATPTFTAQNSTSGAVQSSVEDPFATFSSSDQMFNGIPNEQNLLHEQQLWLQNQNKIIAKHMA
ncbi:PREDICTED: clathrin coat assembly protein AP180-like [Nicotiana attenuata]|uniref:Clathrin coat assembly protein ap180 n=1 Tax=Nicotiana attenuata TaxID=49451 RepID=A0A1J6K4K5_NICAT|nr:PREDICTED: clathrin coat assembly protein AP180-like [Nicotiana attenuata]OIT25002.1 clathrin coat assembly protein ap180 [Nicotiana attenuata]